jgi:hypothetical protein
MRLGPPFYKVGSLELAGRQRRNTHYLGLLCLVLSAYLVWPYVTLWRLDRALIQDDQTTLAQLVDLDSVRIEMRRQLNKEEVHGHAGPVSDSFIAWLEEGIRRAGTAALEQAVTLQWVRSQLLAHSPPGAGLGPALAQAFFEDPLHFSLRLGDVSKVPVRVRMRLTGTGWRVTELYY